MVRSKDASSVQDCEMWATNCLQAYRAPGVQASETAWLAPLTPELEAGKDAAHVFCGHLQICANWREFEVETAADPSWVRVPVQAFGRQVSNTGGQVAYLATEDDNVFIIVWSLPADEPVMSHDELYAYCQRVLRDCPPDADTAAGEAAESSCAKEVILPRFHLWAPAAARVPAPILEAGRFGQPRELLAARLALRLPPRGALRKRPRLEQTEPVLKMERSFVVCVWHASLDDLEVPLFAMVVNPNDFSK